MALVVMQSTTSTMDVAKEMVKLGNVSILGSNRTEPGGVMALDQTEGRGQRGRTWYSAPGESLCVTYFVPLSDEAFREAGKMAILAGAAVANALDDMFRCNPQRHIGNSRKPDPPASPFGLKWPNDLMLSGKKLGGILVEIVPHSNKAMIALIGVGINVGVQEFPPDIAATCTSLTIAGLFTESLYTLANRIRDNLDRSVAIQSRYGFTATMADWRRFDKTAGRRYRTETGDGTTIGVVVEVDADGALVVCTESGSLLTVLSASATSEV